MIKVGDHIEHDRSGAYLGRVTDVGKVLVHFDGPRRRDGIAVTWATIHEVKIAA